MHSNYNVMDIGIDYKNHIVFVLNLKEIEIAQGCIANGINALFYVIGERKEQLKLNRVEVEMIESGMIALGCTTDNMANISGMNKKVQKIEEEVHAVGKE